MTTQSAFDLLRAGGTATIVGLLPQGCKSAIDSTGLTFDRRLQGYSRGSNRFRIDIPRYMKMYERGMLKLDGMITARISLDHVDDWLLAMEKSDAITRTIAIL